MRRRRYYGFFLSGRKRGTVIESDHAVYRMFNYPEIVTYDASVTVNIDVGTEYWYYQNMLIGNRVYGVWTTHQIPNQDIMTEAILTLIDMDPVQALLCEVERRPVDQVQ